VPRPTTERYVPAAGRAWLTRLYDPMMALTMREREFRPALVEAVLEHRPETVLDVGCGTGTLARQLLNAHPSVEVVGIDGDEAVLAAARGKLNADERRVQLREGRADALPIADSSIDVVVQSLLLHHLAPATKLAALSEAHRVLVPGGRLVIADWGRPRDPLTGAGFLALRILDGFDDTSDHAAGRLPSLIGQAGFSSVKVKRRWRTVWGSLELIVGAG
jgi:ubiquinone/menaquinone biosynthesis C-methylase UbiE